MPRELEKKLPMGRYGLPPAGEKSTAPGTTDNLTNRDICSTGYSRWEDQWAGYYTDSTADFASSPRASRRIIAMYHCRGFLGLFQADKPMNVGAADAINLCAWLQ